MPEGSFQRASSPNKALAPGVRTCAGCSYWDGRESILRAKYISPWDCLKSRPALLASLRAQLQAQSCSCGRSSPGICPLAQSNSTAPQAQPPAPWKLLETDYAVVLCYVLKDELAPIAKLCLFSVEAPQQKRVFANLPVHVPVAPVRHKLTVSTGWRSRSLRSQPIRC